MSRNRPAVVADDQAKKAIAVGLILYLWVGLHGTELYAIDLPNAGEVADVKGMVAEENLKYSTSRVVTTY